VSTTHLTLGLLNRIVGWLPAVPVTVADAGYGRRGSFRLALKDAVGHT
jgi:hypothetical protein